MAQRGRRSKAQSAATTSAASLIAALKFVNVAQKEIGPTHNTHCVLFDHWVYAFNGVMSAGHKIADDIKACPHTGRFLDALNKCADSVAITLLENGKISITSGKFRAMIECAAFTDIPHIFPDPIIAAIDERITKALSVVGEHATEGAQTILNASVLLRASSALATDRHVLVEYWHGNDLPPGGLVMPKASVAAIVKCGKKLKGFGYSRDEMGVSRSATFHFEDDSWIKTQLYEEKWPDCDSVFNSREANAWPLPKGFIDAVKAVESFSDDGGIYTHGTKLTSHLDPAIGACYDVEGLPKDRSYFARYLLDTLPLANTIDFGPEIKSCAFMFGENYRAAVAPRQILPQTEDPNTTAYVASAERAAFTVPVTAPDPSQAPAGFPVASGITLPPAADDYSDDIPF